MSDSFANPWTVAHQTPLSMGFPRWEQWSGLQFPPPGNPSHPGIEPVYWQVSFYHWATKEAQTKILRFTNYERLIFFVICHFFLLKFYHVLLLLIFPLCIHIMAVFKISSLSWSEEIAVNSWAVTAFPEFMCYSDVPDSGWHAQISHVENLVYGKSWSDQHQAVLSEKREY